MFAAVVPRMPTLLLVLPIFIPSAPLINHQDLVVPQPSDGRSRSMIVSIYVSESVEQHTASYSRYRNTPVKGSIDSSTR